VGERLVSTTVSRTVKAKFDGDAKGMDRAADKGVAASKRFEKGLERLGETGAKIGRKIDQGMAGARQGLGKLGDLGKKAGGGLAKGLQFGLIGLAGIGLAAGVAVLGGIQKAMQDNASKVKLAASLGMEGEDAKRIGKLAGQLYVQGYGDSIEESGNILKPLFKENVLSLKNTNAEIRDMAAAAKTYADISEHEVADSTRAVANMIRTGIAKNGVEAYDLLTKATQKGLDKADDLTDTLNEYSTQFRKLGLDGPKALGLISQGLQAGARDSDIVADALKEFSIRAIDGSKASADGFKSLGLSAKTMTADLANGGPKASAALGAVLDKLRAVKDPAERSRIAVALFGTQAEDLGEALYALDVDTAAKQMDGYAGSTKRANDAMSATPLARLETTKRLIQQTFVDLIGKLVLPYLEKFGAWFNGPGKYVLADWALAGVAAVVGFADQMLASLDGVLGFVGKWGKALLYSMAATVAVFNPSLAMSFKKAGDEVGDFSKRTQGELQAARSGIAKTQEYIAKARLVTKLTAQKDDLDAKIAAAKAQLADPKLSSTKRAKLEADIRQLIAAKAEAQRQINSLQGKTVKVTINTYKNMIETGPGSTSVGVKAPGRASGGTMLPGHSYLVGENGPEPVTMRADGTGWVSPSGTAPAEVGGSGSMIAEIHVHVGDEVVRVIRTEIKADKRDTRRTVKARAGR
jgi:hypothetical protein